jgi:CheY-like chemotaxis protein
MDRQMLEPRATNRATDTPLAFPPKDIAPSRFIPGCGDVRLDRQSGLAAAGARTGLPPLILVVDDDPDVLEVTGALLIDAGYRVRHAYDGLLALWEIETHPPDLILTDVHMPRLDGLSLARQVAAQPRPIPVILMSADPLLRGDGHPLLTKPFDVDAMLLQIERTLDQ